MSFVVAVPEYVAAAATDLANLGSAIDSARMAALGPTSSIVAAGADEVSAAMAGLFSGHAQAFQALSAQAGRFHSAFTQALSSGGNLYAAAESSGPGDFGRGYGVHYRCRRGAVLALVAADRTRDVRQRHCRLVRPARHRRCWR